MMKLIENAATRIARVLSHLAAATLAVTFLVMPARSEDRENRERKEWSETWVYPRSHKNQDSAARSGDGELAAIGGVFLTEASFEKVVRFYADLAGIPKKADLLESQRGSHWRIWADAPVKSMLFMDRTRDGHAHASFLLRRPGAFSASISIVRYKEASRTRISVSYLPESTVRTP